MWHRWPGCLCGFYTECQLCVAVKGFCGLSGARYQHIIMYHLQCGCCCLRGWVCSHGLWCVQAARAASSLVLLYGSFCQGKRCTCCLSCRSCSPQAQPCSWKGRWNCVSQRLGSPVWEAGGAVFLCQGALLTCSAKNPRPGCAGALEVPNQVQIQLFGTKGLHFSVE